MYILSCAISDLTLGAPLDLFSTQSLPRLWSSPDPKAVDVEVKGMKRDFISFYWWNFHSTLGFLLRFLPIQRCALKPCARGCDMQAITSAGFHTALVFQLFSSWRSRRILPTNSYSCLSLLLVSHKKCRMNLIGPWHFGAFLRDQSDSSYIA